MAVSASGLPRLSVRRSNKYIYAQVIDRDGRTAVGVRSKKAAEAGAGIAKAATAKKIKNVVFDKGSYRYHGQVKALAEAAREAGLKF